MGGLASTRRRKKRLFLAGISHKKPQYSGRQEFRKKREGGGEIGRGGVKGVAGKGGGGRQLRIARGWSKRKG